MRSNETIKNKVWTWADVLSSYSFWGLILAFILLNAVSVVLDFTIATFGRDLNIQTIHLGILLSINSFGGILGFYFSWLSIRTKKLYPIYIFIGAIMLALSLLLIMKLLPILVFTSLVVSISIGVFMVIIPSLFARSNGGSQLMVVALGLFLFFNTSSGILARILFSAMTDLVYLGVNGCIITILIMAVASMIFIIPIKSTMFTDSPKDKAISLEPKYRTAESTVLLCFVPLYNIYHFIHKTYRMHAEVYSITQSRNILPAKSAVWLTIFVPVISPIMLTKLNDVMLEKGREYNVKSMYPSRVVIWFSILFYPIAFGVIQSNLNKLNNALKAEA